MAWGEDEAIGPDVASAGLHVSERIGRDAAAQPDLEEALEASRYSSHPYSSHPKELQWPPLVEIAETRQLPPMLIERYNAAAGEGTALCGIFSDIHRAWATVDNSFFIWRFDKWDGQCQDYNVDEQAICAVGLARAKPGIFVEAIQYLLVLATPVELVLVGVCCSASADGTDPYAELSLQPLPEYMIATDGVTVTCITCTDKGQIFLAGRDGHIYELQYTTGSGWRKRCRKVCLTTGIGSLLSRWVLPNAFKFSTVDPIVDMVIDDERNTIYARTEGMKLQLFDLGANGDGPLTKVTEEKNIVDPRDAPYGGRRSNAQRSARSPKPSIVCISPLSSMESKWLHAVAVLSDGKRLFLTTSGGSGSSVGLSSSLQRPTCLKIVATRPSPPLGVGGGLTFGAVSAAGRAHPEDLALKVESAFYSAGALIMSDSSATAMSSLLAVQKDSAAQLSLPSTFGTASRSSRALRETVSALPVEGRMLCASDVLPLPDAAFTVQSLYADVECFTSFRKPSEKASIKLWAKGDLPTQHILPRRRVVVFNTMGLMEVIFNRPVDILRKLFDGNTLRSQIEEFFNRFGAGEAAAMCLMLAAKLLYAEDSLISNAVSEKAAEAFEDPGLVGMPQIDGTTALSNTRTQAGGFSMGQVVQEAEPLFSGAYEGLCLCSSRLLYPIWELPIMVIRGPAGANEHEDGIVVCRLSAGALKILESKIRSLETFLRSRRNKRRGLYGYVAGLGDSGSILYKTGPIMGSGGRGNGRSPYNSQIRDMNPTDQSASSKKPRLVYTSAELAAMEVRAMECLRRLLRRSGEALFLLQLICHHNVVRLAQTLGNDLRKKLVQLTFHQLVCSEDGDQLAMRLISALMEYYIGPEGRGTVEEISTKLREGCPSYFNESDYKYYLAVECLERASMTNNPDERDILARDAFNLLTKIPDSADLSAICKRFENLRFYEAVVRLPLQKAQALDSNADVINGQIDPRHHDMITLQREQCYEIVMNALRTLKGVGQGADKSSGLATAVDPASRSKYIKQIIQLSVQWPDTVFHEHLYRTLIELGLENELLEYGGSDLVSFLQSAGRKHQEEVRAVSSLTSGAAKLQDLGAPISTSQTKYLELLARYYVLKGEHIAAARMLLILAERQCSNSEEAPTLDKRYEYLRNAVLQAKSAGIAADSSRNPIDSSTVDLLEGKLAVLRFQMQIKQELELMAARVENILSNSESPNDPFPRDNILADAEAAKAAKDKAKELSLGLKSITQLYNDYAVPFNLWEVCLEMLSFANYSGDADSKIVREIWARLLDQALTRGGVAEACSVVKRVGSKLDPADGACLPLDIISLHLEKAALDRLSSGEELVGDDDVARALLGACKGLPEPVLAVYDQLLSNGAIMPSLNIKLRLLRSVLAILREWGMSVIAHRLGTTSAGASFFFDGTFSLNQTGTANQGARDKIISLANRYMTEVRRLNLPQNQTENVYRGFRELEEKLLSPY
ncbi:nuclear pore complex protein NUP155 [Setaria viridis]|uniref:nuclear pore complex protein NUP155 n=1 Tax=Setaria viridis TaxID=4556 RepID=UPI003B3A48F7